MGCPPGDVVRGGQVLQRLWGGASVPAFGRTVCDEAWSIDLHSSQCRRRTFTALIHGPPSADHLTQLRGVLQWFTNLGNCCRDSVGSFEHLKRGSFRGWRNDQSCGPRPLTLATTHARHAGQLCCSQIPSRGVMVNLG